MKPSSQTVNLVYIQDTIEFLKTIENFAAFPHDLVLCTIDLVGVCPNKAHEKGLIAIKKGLDTRTDQTISTDSLMELAEVILKLLKNNIFERNKSF